MRDFPVPGLPCKTRRKGSEATEAVACTSRSSSATRSATFSQNPRCSRLQAAWLARHAAQGLHGRFLCFCDCRCHGRARTGARHSGPPGLDWLLAGCFLRSGAVQAAALGPGVPGATRHQLAPAPLPPIIVDRFARNLLLRWCLRLESFGTPCSIQFRRLVHVHHRRCLRLRQLLGVRDIQTKISQHSVWFLLMAAASAIGAAILPRN